MRHSMKPVATIIMTSMLTTLFMLVGCSNNDEGVQQSEVQSKSSSSSQLASANRNGGPTFQSYPQAEQEILEAFEGIAQSLRDGDMDRLISYHAYGPKFTEFKNGELRNGAEANEAYEREVFGAVTEVVKFEALDLQIAVYYGNVANVTFHSNFHLMFGDDLVIVNEQESLLFAKIRGEWKIVAEHHAPLSNAELLVY